MLAWGAVGPRQCAAEGRRLVARRGNGLTLLLGDVRFVVMFGAMGVRTLFADF